MIPLSHVGCVRGRQSLHGDCSKNSGFLHCEMLFRVKVSPERYGLGLITLNSMASWYCITATIKANKPEQVVSLGGIYFQFFMT